MTDITRISIDTSKSVFTLHAVNAAGNAVLRRNLRRAELVPFFEKLPPVEVARRRAAGRIIGGVCCRPWGIGCG